MPITAKQVTAALRKQKLAILTEFEILGIFLNEVSPRAAEEIRLLVEMLRTEE